MGLAKRVHTARQMSELIPAHVLRCLAPRDRPRPGPRDWRSAPVATLGPSAAMLRALAAARLETAGEFRDFHEERCRRGTLGMFGVPIEDFCAAVDAVSALEDPPKPPPAPRPPRPETRYILPEYCDGPFYMGWWLYERDRPDGSPNDEPRGRWGWLRDGRSVDEVRALVVGLGHDDAPPVDRHAPGGTGTRAFVDWFAARFPRGFRVRVAEGGSPRYRDAVDLNRKPGPPEPARPREPAKQAMLFF